MDKEYYQIVTELDDSEFRELPRNKHDALQIVYDNVWSMFDKPYDCETRKKMIREGKQEFGLSVSDYAWTKEVQDAFENHPFHKKFIKNNSTKYGWFTLNSYPCKFNSQYMEIKS